MIGPLGVVSAKTAASLTNFGRAERGVSVTAGVGLRVTALLRGVLAGLIVASMSAR